MISYIKKWIYNRRLTKLANLAVETMFIFGEARIGRELSDEECTQLAKHFAVWLEEDASRVSLLLDRPTYALHLFLSTMYP